MNEKSNFQKIPKFKGEILLCDDSEINQYVIKSHLVRHGLDVVIANNGKESVDIVGDRIERGDTPFGLILMDIYMPEMDGMEATGALSLLGNKTPVIALTADDRLKSKEVYSKHGFSGFMNKPVAMDELLSCLHNYFTPSGYETGNDRKRPDDEGKRRKRLLTNFVKKNQSTFADITVALKEGDIKLAHRLAHTLRGLAGLMGKAGLQEAARVVEYSLADGNMENIKEQLSALEHELNPVLDELAYLLDGQNPDSHESVAFDKVKAKELFDKAELLLNDDSAACLSLTDELRQIPGTGILIEQIDDYEFETALETLINLRKLLEV